MDTALDIEKEEKQATQLPEPTGYRILIAIPEKATAKKTIANKANFIIS